MMETIEANLSNVAVNKLKSVCDSGLGIRSSVFQAKRSFFVIERKSESLFCKERREQIDPIDL